MKNIITFSKDNFLLETLYKFDEELKILNYNYDAVIEDIDFSNSIVLVDIDNEALNLVNFLQDLSIYAKTKILVLSINCERKLINLAAKYGAAAFLVKPLTKKRYRSHVLPYFNTKEDGNIINELSFIEQFNVSS